MASSFQTISSQVKKILQAKFPERVSFSRAERLLYSHDLGSLPVLIKPLVSRCMAEGIVQPQKEEELIFLLRLASQRHIPLTPRGKGTSGYGGAIPRYGGLVVDCSRMNRILEIDPERLTATVEPGVVWLDLEKELALKGLALRLYPGSAPSSTVGGWLAQGGSGFGSYAYGWFGDNVVSAKVVQPDGKIVAYGAGELDLVRDVEGLTGLITEICLKVMPAKPLMVVAASFENAAQLSDVFNNVVGRKLKLWSVSFQNPSLGKLKDRLRRQEGIALSGLTGVYQALFVFPASAVDTRSSLEELIHSCQGRLSGRKISEMLWEERYEILKIKKLAPSLISSKVAIPLLSLRDAIEEAGRIKHPMLMEGVILQEHDKCARAVLLGFIPYDERKISYNMVYGLALSYIKLTEKMGGRPCATGIYFKRQAPRIIGRDRLGRLISKKKTIDPHNILNPGKVIGKDLLDFLMKMAWEFESLIRLLANRIRSPQVSEPDAGYRGDISWQAFCCDQCGFCVAGCSKFNGWETQTPRGRWYLLRLVMKGKLKLAEVIDKMQLCRDCEGCKITCPQGLPPIRPEMLNPMELTYKRSQSIIDIEEPDAIPF